MAFSGIVPGKAGNGSASGFVNSAVNASTPNSAIHKAAGLTVPGHSMILPGTIPETHISCEWSWWLEQPLGVVPIAGRTPTGGFVNSAVRINGGGEGPS